jgi:hypothetical protein
VDLPFRIPVEELVFFLAVPVCGILTYAGVQAVSRRWTAPAKPQVKSKAEARP